MIEFNTKSTPDILNNEKDFNRIAIAFQPIVDTRRGKVWGYEALTRGPRGECYPTLVEGMDESRRGIFDKLAAAKALAEASRLRLLEDGVKLTINVRPNVDVAKMDATFVAQAAAHYGVPISSIVLELTEDAKLSCGDFLKVMALHRSLGLATGIDDFGAGYSGLNVLATCGAEMVKLDQHLVRGVDKDTKRQIIVESFTRLCGRLGSLVVAEGIETKEEAATLRELGVELMQGYYFGRPVIGAPPAPRLEIEGERRSRRVLAFHEWTEVVPMRA